MIYKGKFIYKWIMTGVTPILGNPHMYGLQILPEKTKMIMGCYPPVNHLTNGTWPIIVRGFMMIYLVIMVIFRCYVKLPEGNQQERGVNWNLTNNLVGVNRTSWDLPFRNTGLYTILNQPAYRAYIFMG
jgi:hypothetical protein